MRTDIQEGHNHLIRVGGIELNRGDILIVYWGLESPLNGLKQILTIDSPEGIDIDLTVGGDGHILVILAKGTLPGGLDHVWENDSPEAIGSPNSDFPTDENDQLAIRTSLQIVDVHLFVKLIFFQL